MLRCARLVLVLLVCFAGGARALGSDDLVSATAPAPSEPDDDARYAPGEVVVRWRAGVSLGAVRAVGGKLAEPEAIDGISVVRVPPGREVESARQLGALAEVAWAQPNYLRRAQVASNDPLFGQQWGLQRIQAPAAWDTTMGTASVVVAVVDTGVDLRHPDLQGRLLPGRNLLQPDALPQDDGGHGTHVAGTIAATLNNSIGIAGVASGVSIMPVKVLRANGSGKDTNVAAGIRWATDNGARVINMSFTGADVSPILNEAVAYATARNVALVVAAGNEGSNTPTYPAATEPVIAVAATDTADRRASFSNFGGWVDIAAPGTDILSTYWDAASTYRADSGTSMAAPHVTGVIALLASIHPTLTLGEIEALLKATAEPTAENGIGVGRLNAARAVVAATQFVPESAAVSPGPLSPNRSGTAPGPGAPLTAQPLAISYNAPLNGQTVHLPLVRQNAGGWTTEISVQSVVDRPGSVVVQFVDADGSVPGAITFTLPGLGSATIVADVPGRGSAPWEGGAVVRAQMPVAASVRMSQREGDSAGYDGRVGGAPVVFGPLIFKNRNNWSTSLALQNLGREATGVEIVYSGRGETPGVWRESARIPPAASRIFSQAANLELPDGFEGSVHVRSTNDQPLALVVLETNAAGAASAYAGFGAGGTDLSAPVVFKNRATNGTWNTGIQIQNLGAEPARVRLVYSLGEDNGATVAEVTMVAPGAAYTFYQPDSALPDGFTGAARIVVENQQPIVGLVHAVNYERNLSTVYELLGAGDLVVHVPLVLKGVNGQNGSLQVQNRGSAPANVSIAYRAPGGTLVATVQDSIELGSFKTYYQPTVAGLPDRFVGSATITSQNGQPVAAIANSVRY